MILNKKLVSVLYDLLFVLCSAGGAVLVVGALRSLLSSKVFSINLSLLSKADVNVISSAYSSLVSFYVLSALLIVAFYIFVVFLHVFLGLFAWGAVCGVAVKGSLRLFLFYLAAVPFVAALCAAPSFFGWHFLSLALFLVFACFSFFFKPAFLECGKVFSSFGRAFSLAGKVFSSPVFYAFSAVFAAAGILFVYLKVVALIFAELFVFVFWLRRFAGGLK